MPGSSYHRLGNLATHPAFSWQYATLVCRWKNCGEEYDRVPDYDRHYLAHDPPHEHAERWLSGRTYTREAAKRDDWPLYVYLDGVKRPVLVWGHKPAYRRRRTEFGYDAEVSCTCGGLTFRGRDKLAADAEFYRHLVATLEVGEH